MFAAATQPAYACSTDLEPDPTPTPADGASPQPGYAQPDMGQTHVATGTTVTYTYCPPASGRHYNRAGVGPDRRRGSTARTTAVSPQGWIHNLEHGGLVVLYRGDSERRDRGRPGRPARPLRRATRPSPVCGFPRASVGPVIRPLRRHGDAVRGPGLGPGPAARDARYASRSSPSTSATASGPTRRSRRRAAARPTVPTAPSGRRPARLAEPRRPAAPPSPSAAPSAAPSSAAPTGRERAASGDRADRPCARLDRASRRRTGLLAGDLASVRRFLSGRRPGVAPYCRRRAATLRVRGSSARRRRAGRRPRRDPAGKIVCVGLNYARPRRRGRPAGADPPLLFAKFANAIIGDGEPIVRPEGTHALDLEVELGVVIGTDRPARDAEDALDHVAGYVVLNDVSARDWQGIPAALREGEVGDGQWLRAKGSDTFLPMGPASSPPTRSIPRGACASARAGSPAHGPRRRPAPHAGRDARRT